MEKHSTVAVTELVQQLFASKTMQGQNAPFPTIMTQNGGA